MNIIAGERKGAVLFAPKGTDTRPTSAKVKESLFNILQSEVPEARVLDLFAGSGSLSLEALSRGAAFAFLCDADREAASAIKRNINKLRYSEKTRLVQTDWRAALLGLTPSEACFDLVFLDPPYRMEITQDCASLLAERKLLAAEALLAIEHRKGLVPSMPSCFELLRLKTYGDTEIHFYRYHAPKEEHLIEVNSI